MAKKLIGTATAVSSSKPLINLLAGWPNSGLLPPQGLRLAADDVCNDESISTPALCYGPDEGYRPLREAIASWLTDFYQRPTPTTFAEICITGGASQNLACILQTFSDPVYTRNIWLVSPTYFHACKIFDDAGFANKLKAVPEDAEGIDIEYLETAIKASEDDALRKGNTKPTFKSPRPWRKSYKHMIYAAKPKLSNHNIDERSVPTFSNPSGRLMSLARREALVRLARKYDALIVTDDVYDMLQWRVDLSETTSNESHRHELSLDHACLPRLVDIDATLDGGPVTEFGNAVSNGTFSKIVAPGCRTGWAQGTAKMAWGVSQTGSSKSGGAPSQFTSTLIHQLLINSELQKHINQTLLPAYSRRYHLMLDAINTHLVPLGCTLISQPAKVPSNPQPLPARDSIHEVSIAGGYFHYITLPPRLAVPPVHTREEPKTVADYTRKLALEQENLMVMAGPMFRVEGDQSEIDKQRYHADIRLSFAWAEEEDIEKGVKRLAAVIQRELDAQ